MGAFQASVLKVGGEAPPIAHSMVGDKLKVCTLKNYVGRLFTSENTFYQTSNNPF